MDESRIDARGLEPLRALFSRIDAIRFSADAVNVLAELHAHGVKALFASYAEADLHDVGRMLLWLDEGALGLPSRDDYLRSGGVSAELRAHYRQHLARLLHLLGEPDAARAADQVFAFETALAQRGLSAVEERDDAAGYHLMTLGELRARFPAIDWPAYLSKLGAPATARLNVRVPGWLEAVDRLLGAGDFGPLRAYLRVHLVRTLRTSLPSAIERELFDFDQHTARGVREMAPRWKRCLALVDRDIGDDLGRIFVARYFPDASRARVIEMVERIRAAFCERLASVEWLGPEARQAAAKKLANQLFGFGMTKRPYIHARLQVDRTDAAGNAWRALGANAAQSLALLASPTDRERFFDSHAQSVDGFGSQEMNATGFTAGILQPPFFDPTMDDAVNFGGFGGIIGHELTHHFDDEGRKYDASGNIRPWWSPADVEKFEARAKCFVDEYARFHTSDGTPLDGKLTLGENIADNGGLRLAYAALRPSNEGPKINGFTPAQRFFLAWGQIRCENVTPAAERRQALSSVHAPGRFRVDGVVSNIPEFARAFSCAPGTPMAPENQCRLW